MDTSADCIALNAMQIFKGKKKGKCHYCQTEGHWAADCYKKKNAEASTSGGGQQSSFKPSNNRFNQTKKKWNKNDYKGKGKGKANFGMKKWIREADLEEEEEENDDEADINFIDNMHETLGRMDEDMRKEFFMALQKDFH